jgi:anti-anti-sigma factor
MMVISSRPPEGQPNRCPVCGNPKVKIEPSDPDGDAPCRRCGHLLWFTWDDRGDEQVIQPIDQLLQVESLDRLVGSVAMRPGMRLILDFSDVRNLSSAVLGTLINLKKKLATVQGKVALRGLQPDLREVFRFSRLDQVLEIED